MCSRIETAMSTINTFKFKKNSQTVKKFTGLQKEGIYSITNHNNCQ